MPRPLPDHLIERAKELLAEKATHRGIAGLLGISRQTVGLIASGKRQVKPRRPAPPRPAGPYVRCGGCGGKVQMPCVACSLKRTGRRLPPGATDDDLRLALRGRARDRQQAIAARKRLSGEVPFSCRPDDPDEPLAPTVAELEEIEADAD